MARTHPPVHTSVPVDPWAIAEADFPRDATIEEQLRFLIGYAVLAPSGHNSQPWIFWVNRNAVELYADRARTLPVADPDNRELARVRRAAGRRRLAARLVFAHGRFDAPEQGRGGPEAAEPARFDRVDGNPAAF